MERLQRICKNCFDYDGEKEVCLIRYIIPKNKARTPMKRKPSQTGCQVFMYKTNVEGL